MASRNVPSFDDADAQDMSPEAIDFQRLDELNCALQRGDAPEVTEELTEFVARVARRTVVDESIIIAMRSDPSLVMRVAKDARERFRLGSRRLMAALSAAYRAEEAGDRSEARRVLRRIIESEPIPFYRDIAEGQLVEIGLDSVDDDERSGG
jgi:DUSAM domain-containing protein